MQKWSISLSKAELSTFSDQKHEFVRIPEFLEDPEFVRNEAVLQKFAKITPQYPGVRAPIPESVALDWSRRIKPMLRETFETEDSDWEMLAWFSLVTAAPAALLPIQRLPHVDGTESRLIAMMLYLDHTPHGGTAFFRHKATGFECLTPDSFPVYKASLESEVRKTGLPQARYVTDGEPHFERIHASSGDFNEAIFYRGNVFHSGIIDNNVELSPDPISGRLTINAMFMPK